MLGKRDASEAGIDGTFPIPSPRLPTSHAPGASLPDTDTNTDPNTLLRSLRESENKYTSLKRQFLALQGVEQVQKDEIRNLKDDNEELRQHRSNLLNVSTDADSSAAQKEKAYQDERVRFSPPAHT